MYLKLVSFLSVTYGRNWFVKLTPDFVSAPEVYVPVLTHQSSIPPDGTTFSHLTLGDPQKTTIPPYSYWNFQVN
jgi:hypothetical protein